jgi:hypothetical protein
MINDIFSCIEEPFEHRVVITLENRARIVLRTGITLAQAATVLAGAVGDVGYGVYPAQIYSVGAEAPEVEFARRYAAQRAIRSINCDGVQIETTQEELEEAGAKAIAAAFLASEPENLTPAEVQAEEETPF